MKSKLTTKYVRPTHCIYGHTNLFLNQKEIGYIIPNRSKFRTVGENWNFVPTCYAIDFAEKNKINRPHFASNRQKIIRLIKESFNAE